jgi:hypothetical protein
MAAEKIKKFRVSVNGGQTVFDDEQEAITEPDHVIVALDKRRSTGQQTLVRTRRGAPALYWENIATIEVMEVPEGSFPSPRNRLPGNSRRALADRGSPYSGGRCQCDFGGSWRAPRLWRWACLA